MDAVAEHETNAFVRRLHGALADASDSADDTSWALMVLRTLLAHDARPRGDTVALLPPSVAAAASESAQWEAWCRAFLDRHYAGLLDSATVLLADAGRVQALPPGVGRQLDELYLAGPPIDAFCALADLVPLSSRRGPYAAGKAALMLEEFVARRHGIAAALRSHAIGLRTVSDGGSLAIDGFASRLASLPDHAANRFQRETSPSLMPAAYVGTVADDIVATLRDVRNELAAGRDCTLTLVAAVVGKLCITGRAELLCCRLLPAMQKCCQSDFIWIRVWHRLIVNIPSRMQENFLIQLFLHVKWYKNVEHLLGNTVLENHSLRHLITNKMLFHKFFHEVHVLQNIIGYLATSPSRHSLFIEVLHNVLDVWCDSSCIKRSSYEQHAYISRALIVCFSFLSDQDKTVHRQAILGKLMNGVQEHIGSNSVAVRRLGMIVAELGTESLSVTTASASSCQGSTNTDSEYKLKFEYEQDAEVDELRALARAPLEPPSSPTGQDDSEAAAAASLPAAISDPTSNEVYSGDTQQLPAKDTINNDDAQIDSDDDLEPYDMSADQPKSKVATPAYIRDCMEGLVSSDQPEQVQVSLAVSAQLIRRSTTGVKEVAAEFCKILLHLSNNFSLSNYETSRHSAMVALLVTAPVETAEYLTGEICARNYTVLQRLDTLEALSAGAQELSQLLPPGDVPGQAAGRNGSCAVYGSVPPGAMAAATRSVGSSVSQTSTSDEVRHWTQIVDDRIKAKTRVFARGPRQPPAIAAANRFAPVAGNFFFPLLVNVSRRTEGSFDLLSEDNTIVLVKFIVTLAKIMLAASNAPISVKMGRHLLDFIWNLRYHSDRSVRVALLFAVIAVFLAIPVHLVMDDFVEDVTEFAAWLEDLDSREADPECRKMVGRAMQVLQQRTQAAMRLDAETRLETE